MVKEIFRSTVNSSALCSYVTLCTCYRVFVTLLYSIMFAYLMYASRSVTEE